MQDKKIEDTKDHDEILDERHKAFYAYANKVWPVKYDNSTYPQMQPKKFEVLNEKDQVTIKAVNDNTEEHNAWLTYINKMYDTCTWNTVDPIFQKAGIPVLGPDEVKITLKITPQAEYGYSFHKVFVISFFLFLYML